MKREMRGFWDDIGPTGNGQIGKGVLSLSGRARHIQK